MDFGIVPKVADAFFGIEAQTEKRQFDNWIAPQGNFEFEQPIKKHRATTNKDPVQNHKKNQRNGREEHDDFFNLEKSIVDTKTRHAIRPFFPEDDEYQKMIVARREQQRMRDMIDTDFDFNEKNHKIEKRSNRVHPSTLHFRNNGVQPIVYNIRCHNLVIDPSSSSFDPMSF